MACSALTHRMTIETTEVLIVGAGPAGLMAAEILSASGHRVVVTEAKPSPARKFLMAGKSGLNITKAEPIEEFIASYGDAAGWLAPAIRAFGPQEVEEWVRSLGREVFVGTTGRVFPVEMKASPLLRAWLSRLARNGVELRTRWRWKGWQEDTSLFETPNGEQRVRASATVLAMGGASWARLGSDGKWTTALSRSGVGLDPFAPSNVGLAVSWSEHMAKHFGAPVKNVALTGDGKTHRGEFVISKHGLEGGAIYALSPAARQHKEIELDLLPDMPVERVRERLARNPGKQTISNHLRKVLRLDPVKIALLREFGGQINLHDDLARDLKALPIRYEGTRPMDEAISVAGGVQREALDDGYMLRSHPGVFCCGEMISWEAPTGGYLLTGCLATGRWAGCHASEWLRRCHETDASQTLQVS